MKTRAQVRPIVTAITVHRLSPDCSWPTERTTGDSNECTAGSAWRARMTVQADGATVTETVIHEVRSRRSKLSRPGSGEGRVMGVPARMPEDRAQQAVARVFARRERHCRRPLPVRIAVAVAGFVLLALAAVLVLFARKLACRR